MPLIGEKIMKSKIIYDAPEILGESLVTLSAACRYVPGGCSRPTIERWIRQGNRGVFLQSALICGKRMVSVEGLNRFILAQLRVEQPHAEPLCDQTK